MFHAREVQKLLGALCRDLCGPPRALHYVLGRSFHKPVSRIWGLPGASLRICGGLGSALSLVSVVAAGCPVLRICVSSGRPELSCRGGLRVPCVRELQGLPVSANEKLTLSNQ